MRCPSCRAENTPGARFCASCGAPFGAAGDATVLSGRGADETRLSGTPATPSRPSVSASGSGWLSSGVDIDHGRFPPGTLVGDRYRIVGLLGRGGMGEVFRADDLRLGQPVALKFLPPVLERDTTRLAQFHNEVRTARQVSHSNVCRVYDIGEVDGQHFLTMEYVDGEDLSSLLRRIGRLPEDKAIEIARQICAGLHAAHERGLLHRDLKPANIMLDREGRVRITDFSLAAVAGTVEDIRAGTPAYMAPEQLAGREVTARSDIYALGLVLYELFTGKRALDAKTVGDLISLQESGAITHPTDVVTSLDPLIDRTIMRCLQTDPARRPASAIAVSASLPGGDPLAAALAAGETPSPEMVAAAGTQTAAVTPLQGALWMASVVVMLVAVTVLAGKYMLLSRTPFDRPPEVLFDRARAFERELGLGSRAVDYAAGFALSNDYLRWLASRPDGLAGLSHSQPAPILYWYRSSPRTLVASNGRGGVNFGDPPATVTGMTNMVFGADGKLYEFHLVPSQVESLSTPAPRPVDWSRFFVAAGLDPSRFKAVAPDWTPRSFADEREAWIGSLAHLPDAPVRVDVASHQNYPVYFQVSGPWARPARMTTFEMSQSARIAGLVSSILMALMIFGSAWLARRNLRRGRGDRRGAVRAGAVMLTLQMLAWLFGAHHVPDAGVQTDQFFNAIAAALFQASLFALFYLAVEPHVRRVWPHVLITWSRLTQGSSVRDPLVGRDLLIGTAAGVFLTLLTLLHQHLPTMAGRPEFWPEMSNVHVVETRIFIGVLFERLSFALQNGALGVLGLTLLRMLLRRTSAAVVVGSLLFGFMAARGQLESDLPLYDYAGGVLLCVVLFAIVLRYGLFATCVAFFVHFTTHTMPATLDTSRLHFTSGAIVLAIAVTCAGAGYYLSRAGEPLFGKVLDD